MGIIILTIVTFIIGILLSLLNMYLFSDNEKIKIVHHLLPGYNCGSCGKAGCKNFAEAIVQNNEDPKKCRPLRDAAYEKIIESLED